MKKTVKKTAGEMKKTMRKRLPSPAHEGREKIIMTGMKIPEMRANYN